MKTINKKIHPEIDGAQALSYNLYVQNPRLSEPNFIHPTKILTASRDLVNSIKF